MFRVGYSLSQLTSDLFLTSLPSQWPPPLPSPTHNICILNDAWPKVMTPHSSTLAWKIPWTEEPGRLQSMGSPRVGHDRATSLSLFTFMHWRRIWQPTPVFLPGESQGRGSLVSCCLGSHRVGHDWSDLEAEEETKGLIVPFCKHLNYSMVIEVLR